MFKIRLLLEIIFFLMVYVLSRDDGDRLKQNACQLPKGLEYKPYHSINQYHADHFFSDRDYNGLELNVRNKEYKFDLEEWEESGQYDFCDGTEFDNSVHVRFRSKLTLTSRLNLQGVIDFLLLFHEKFQMTITNLNSIEIDSGIVPSYSRTKMLDINFRKIFVNILNTAFDFRLNGRPVESCRQLIDANMTQPNTLLQISAKDQLIEMFWLNDRYLRPMCPLLFKNTRISRLIINGMDNSFYMKNVIQFTKDTFDDLNSSIAWVKFYKSENLIIDKMFLNPSVFENIEGNFIAF